MPRDLLHQPCLLCLSLPAPLQAGTLTGTWTPPPAGVCALQKGKGFDMEAIIRRVKAEVEAELAEAGEGDSGANAQEEDGGSLSPASSQEQFLPPTNAEGFSAAFPPLGARAAWAAPSAWVATPAAAAVLATRGTPGLQQHQLRQQQQQSQQQMPSPRGISTPPMTDVGTPTSPSSSSGEVAAAQSPAAAAAAAGEDPWRGYDARPLAAGASLPPGLLAGTPGAAALAETATASSPTASPVAFSAQLDLSAISSFTCPISLVSHRQITLLGRDHWPPGASSVEWPRAPGILHRWYPWWHHCCATSLVGPCVPKCCSPAWRVGGAAPHSALPPTG